MVTEKLGELVLATTGRITTGCEPGGIAARQLADLADQSLELLQSLGMRVHRQGVTLPLLRC